MLSERVEPANLRTDRERDGDLWLLHTGGGVARLGCSRLGTHGSLLESARQHVLQRTAPPASPGRRQRRNRDSEEGGGREALL